VVNTKFKEFDYPIGSKNAENTYQGTTGIPFTPFNKFMLSCTGRRQEFYLSTEITAESKLLINRNINQRVQKLTPFISYDDDPYAVIDEGESSGSWTVIRPPAPFPIPAAILTKTSTISATP
jgi:uncharacterized membrane protein (UPF0182 family)